LNTPGAFGYAQVTNQPLFQADPFFGPYGVESFVTADKVYSIYIARDQKLIREHAYLSGFPADTIYEVKAVIDPSTAREARWIKEHDVSKESGIC
jgi:Protein of unknown function (DUF4242)